MCLLSFYLLLNKKPGKIFYKCGISMITLRKIYGNVYMRRNPKNTRNTDDSLGSGTKLLLPSWLLRFQNEERETHNFYYADCSIWTHHPAANLVDPNWTGLAQVQKSTILLLVKISTNCFFFSKNPPPKSSAPSLPGMTSFTSPVLFPIRGFYYDISDCHILPARAWRPALNVCPYPCTKPNSF